MANVQLTEFTLRLPRGAIQAITLGIAILISTPLLFIGTALVSLRNFNTPDDYGPGRTAQGSYTWRRCGSPPPQSVDGRTIVRGSSEGFFSDLCINGYGTGVPVLLTERRTLLSWDQAVEFRLKPNRMTFDKTYAHNSGTIRVASAIVPLMSVGDAHVHDMEIYVSLEHTLNQGFLGKDFLARMKWHKIVNGDTLTMIPHVNALNNGDANRTAASSTQK